MMVSEEFKDLLNDAIIFFETIGAMNELAELDLLNHNEIIAEEHKNYIKNLCNKYNIDIEIEDNHSVLEAEDLLYGFFIQQLKLSYENGFKAGLDESRKRYIF